MYKDKAKQRAAVRRYNESAKGKATKQAYQTRKDVKARRYAWTRNWYKNHPELVKQIHQKSNYKKKYGESIENKVGRLNFQGWKCANDACRATIDVTTGKQDHNHETGELRGGFFVPDVI